jgi:small subunit ribosomal protein S2
LPEFLLPQEKYLEAGLHIGTKIKGADMREFIYKARHDKLYVLDIKKTDERLRIAGAMLARYEPKGVLVAASRTYARKPARKFAEMTGADCLEGRFIPGVFTNPGRSDFREPKLLLVCDPRGERQAVKEASTAGIPIIALCDTDSSVKFVDLIVPVNNKGKRAIALIFYLLTREVLKRQGKIAADADFALTVDDFEGVAEVQEEAAQ